MAQGWDRTLAETRAAFDYWAREAGVSIGESERLYAQYQQAVKDGNTELVASIEATYQSWIDDSDAAAAAAAADYERVSSAAVGAFYKAEDAGTTAYDKIYAEAIESGAGQEAGYVAQATAASLAATAKVLAAEGLKYARIAAFDAAMALGAHATQAERSAAADTAAKAAIGSWDAAMVAVVASDKAAADCRFRKRLAAGAYEGGLGD